MKHKLHVRTDDNVVVIAGEERGKRGRVLSVDADNKRVIVEGVNRRTRAIRRTSQNPRGGLEEQECPIHVSNVMQAERYDAKYAEKAEGNEAPQTQATNSTEESHEPNESS